jgi:hypothetical protein
MKKLTLVLLAIAVASLAWGFFAPAHAQDPAKQEKPTFYRLVPGTYVNGWPRFTITYPKDWIEETPQPQQVFLVSDPNPTHGEKLTVSHPLTTLLPLDKHADIAVNFFKFIAKDVTIVSDKPSQLRDGTPAREVELQMVLNSLPFNYLSLATKKGDMIFSTGVGSFRGRIREDLKAILYSIEFEPNKDKPVKPPPDIQKFLDRWCSDFVSHDIVKLMSNYSDKYLNSGLRKGEMERMWRQGISSVTSFEVGVTDFIPAGDKAYLAGFVSRTEGKFMLTGTSIIKENGEWKWYGNQRDVSP